MRSISIGLLLLCLAAALAAQNAAQGPTDKKAQKSYQQGLEELQKREERQALWYFHDADKLDHGHCLACQEQMVRIGIALKDWKAVEAGAAPMASEVSEPKQQAVAHYYLGLVLLNQGADRHQSDLFTRAHEAFSNALALYSLPDVFFEDGKALAQLHKDEEAKTQFEKYIAIAPEGQFRKWRAQQFVDKPDLARANLVSDFALFTADGQRTGTRALAGKVVLVWFWSSSCELCSHTVPHLQAITKKFQGQPFVILNISVDHDQAAWRSFLDKNNVPGIAYRDGFNGPIAQVFGVGIVPQSSVDNPTPNTWVSSWGVKEDVPRTFTIDADGVLTSEKLSDSLDGKLQEMIARAGQGVSSR